MKLLFTKLFLLTGFCLLEFLPVTAHSQPPLYLVYSVEGKALCRAAGKAVFNPLRRNAALFEGDSLSFTGPGAGIILVAENTEYIRLDKSGLYDMESIRKMQRIRWKDDLTVKYFHLLWEEFFKPRPIAGRLEPATIAGSTGGVSRGGLQLLIPAPVFRTSMQKQVFRWSAVSGATGYVFDLKNETGITVMAKKVTDTFTTLTLLNVLHYGERYRWSLGYLSPTGANSTAISGELECVNEAATVRGLDLTMSDPVPGLVAMIQRASLLETAGCTMAAKAIYEKLTRAHPQDKALLELKTAFLFRNGL